MIGITAYGGYVPRLRLSRQAAAQANAWYAPQFAGRKGTRAFANWDEDSITMAVAAARDCLGPAEARNRRAVRGLLFASDTLPFAERLNAGIAAGALALAEDIDAVDLGGTQRAGLSALTQAVARVQAGGGDTLVLAADNRRTRAGSAQELDYGDAAAALVVGRENVLAEYLGAGTVTADFVDRFRATGEDVDYHWEERWVRDEGIAKLVPRAVKAALANAGVQPAQVDHFIFPSSFARMDQQLAKACGMRPEAVVDALTDTVGETGVPHGLLLLAQVLEGVQPGQCIVLAQFGSGAQALVFRATDAVRTFQPARGVSAWIARGVEDRQYTRFLSFKGQLALERGMRGEQDKKTALSTAWRHHQALQALVAGRCEVTGSVHFPPSRLSYDAQPLQDTQKPHPLADRPARILSWSAEYLSWHPAPPHHYGQIDFEGGGRILMDFTDLDVGEVDAGSAMEMVFRIKDVDERRGFTRYFWKATPVRGAQG
ncbi:3-oxoacyl-[acyl-carrier-protein] synthase III C-terminal domain-containing protein [Pseudorhodoferax sp. Leaf274]|uniref:3-oxoacyl-[acyl-carrier-protein] synthase III C-terminal domain-containing protein n=1 Tax=Pseudorhodoferax sp. Leaf274 TaxID=1736318 RepID=UPI000702B089|nr:3-oxoacyl-[acyl-carrier-protein] synthase III C-terminal domain-containing protein [Pseudorhodoferax sp. Leaf274]KQP45504.1 3-hydroxy-3-methylglutaryl CoA synthase [Pseudorhodoferax sp. Leaf274]